MESPTRSIGRPSNYMLLGGPFEGSFFSLATTETELLPARIIIETDAGHPRGQASNCYELSDKDPNLERFSKSGLVYRYVDRSA